MPCQSKAIRLLLSRHFGRRREAERLRLAKESLRGDLATEVEIYLYSRYRVCLFFRLLCRKVCLDLKANTLLIYVQAIYDCMCLPG